MGKGIDKFMSILNLNGGDDDDDYENDDLFDDEIDLVETKPKQKPKKATPQPAQKAPAAQQPPKSNSIFTSTMKTQPQASSYSDDSDDFGSSSYAKRPKANNSVSKPRPVANNKVVTMSSRGSEVYVIKPQEFNEAQTVTDFLKEGKTIVINMEGIELNSAQRIIDFIGGACYALDGSLQAISSNIFIAAPSSIEVSGDLREEILNDSMVSPNLSAF